MICSEPIWHIRYYVLCYSNNLLWDDLVAWGDKTHILQCPWLESIESIYYIWSPLIPYFLSFSTSNKGPKNKNHLLCYWHIELLLNTASRNIQFKTMNSDMRKHTRQPRPVGSLQPVNTPNSDVTGSSSTPVHLQPGEKLNHWSSALNTLSMFFLIFR